MLAMVEWISEEYFVSLEDLQCARIADFLQKGEGDFEEAEIPLEKQPKSHQLSFKLETPYDFL